MEGVEGINIIVTLLKLHYTDYETVAEGRRWRRRSTFNYHRHDVGVGDDDLCIV